MTECVHAPWPSYKPVLRSCAHLPAAAAQIGGLDADLAWILPRIDKAGTYRLGKLQRNQASALIAGLHRWLEEQPKAGHASRSGCRRAISCIWPHLSCALASSNAQQQQDLLLLPALLDAAGQKPGTFVELGAYDGVQLSNTIMLERCFNFTGLLIEANPPNFERMRQSSGRTRSAMVHSAVCGGAPDGVPGLVQMTVGGGNVARQVLPPDAKSVREQSSNMTTTTTTRRAANGMNAPPHSASRRRVIGNVASSARKWDEKAPLADTVEVPCMPLHKLMRDNGMASGATFLSLDVEGAEELVLRTVDPAVFQYIMVETELEVADRRTLGAVDSIIRGSGMVRAREITGVQYNAVYRQPNAVRG